MDVYLDLVKLLPRYKNIIILLLSAGRRRGEVTEGNREKRNTSVRERAHSLQTQLTKRPAECTPGWTKRSHPFLHMTMASTTAVKDTGFTGALLLLLLGLLLPAVLVSGQNNTTAAVTMINTASQPTTMTSGADSSTTQAPTANAATQSMTVTTGPSTSQALNTTSGATTMTTQSTRPDISSTIQSTTLGASATSGGMATSGGTGLNSTTHSSSTNTTSGGSASNTTTQTLTTTAASGGIASNTTQSSTASATSGGMAMTHNQSTTNTLPSGSFAITSTQSSTTSNTSGAAVTQPNITTMASGGMTGTNGTTVSMSCPSFSCNYSECYSMYSSQNATSCPADSFCQLMRQMNMFYTVSCSASCADSCVNASQINCTENCCNSTGCLNSSFASMMMMNMTTATGTTTTMKSSTTTTTTAVNNGNKCHRGMCTGSNCYTGFKTAALQTCSSSQPHCQLKKETVDSSLQWTAGCISNCSDKTICKDSTPPPCHLECCNATSTSSCLWLNGTLNVPSFATRGPLHTELITCLLCLLAITLML
nr:PREDICTED: uncharacterized protein LOC109633013 [Paralichthys olivaceus]